MNADKDKNEINLHEKIDFKENNNIVILDFGKHKEKSLDEIYHIDKDYFKYLALN